MSLKNVVAQDNVVKILLNEIKTSTVKHAYIFYGIKGVGKKFTALQFSKSLLCPNVKDGYSCDECESCKNIDDNTHPDVIVVDFDFQQHLLQQKEKAESISIDTIRYIKHLSSLTPYSGKYKIFIIDSAETLRNDAANSLLKLLEEPADNRIFILLTTSLGLLPKTVISRCEQLKFLPVSKEKIFEILRYDKKFNFDEIILGSIDEIKYIQSIKELNFDIFSASIAEIQKISTEIVKDKEFAKYFIVWFVENVFYKSYIDSPEWYEYANTVEKYIKQLRYNIDFQLLIETFLTGLKNLCNTNTF